MVGLFTRGTTMVGVLGFPCVAATAPLALTFGRDCAMPMPASTRKSPGSSILEH